MADNHIGPPLRPDAELCGLDYMAGTLSTAYKGMITALVAADFCVAVRAGALTVDGRLLNLPAGEYTLHLMLGGAELSRAAPRDGRFSLSADAAVLDGPGEIRIDLVQGGRHIGSFVIKQRGASGLSIATAELSRDLRGVNLKGLAEMLSDKAGLHASAEALVYYMLSSVKLWDKLSDDMNTFTKNLFWYGRGAFVPWFPLIARFSARAAANVPREKFTRAADNLIGLAELLVENKDSFDEGELFDLARVWVDECAGSAMPMALGAGRFIRAFGAIDSNIDGLDLAPLIRMLIDSVENAGTVLVDERALASAAGGMPQDALSPLMPYTRAGMDRLRQGCAAVREALADNHARALTMLGGLDLRPLHAERGLGNLVPVMVENAASIRQGAFETLAREALRLSRELAAGGNASFDVRDLLLRLIETGSAGHAAKLVHLVSSADMPDLLLEGRIADVVLSGGDNALVSEYLRAVREIRVPSPGSRGISPESWAERTDPAHFTRLKALVNLAGRTPEIARELLPGLIAGLFVGGVHVPDDRLFQRDVSAFLGSDGFRGDYFMGYLLVGRIPVFHAEVGATGRLRDLSTELDSWGNDQGIYFLRKQVHVNASNYNVPLAGAFINAWALADPSYLRGMLPDDIYGSIEPERLREYQDVMRPFLEKRGLLREDGVRLRGILALTDDEAKAGFADASGGEAAAKCALLIQIYREAARKYTSQAQGNVNAQEAPEFLRQGIARYRELREVIIRPGETVPEESLYFKRHIAFGIPSVIGTYREQRFDAMGEALRLDEAMRVAFEAVLGWMESRLMDFSTDDMREWIGCLIAARDLFNMHGLGNRRMDEFALALTRNRLHLSQAADMVRLWQQELAWHVESLYRTFHGPLIDTMNALGPEDLPERYTRAMSGPDTLTLASDTLVRDIISATSGFEELDRMLNAMLKALMHCIESLGDGVLDIVDGAPPEPLEYYDLHGMDADTAMLHAPFLGGKAAHLVRLREAGLSVPEAVTLPARGGESCDDAALMGILRRAVPVIEQRTGLVYGDAERPLLLSVRSGAYVSMPGILESVLFSGMTREVIDGMLKAGHDPLFVWDSRRRLVEHYASVVMGAEVRSITGTLDAEGMRGHVEDMEAELARGGQGMPDDAYEQLLASVRAVYASWDAKRARGYRAAMGISDAWGTSVTLMRMIYGNRSGAGASVFFTRDPSTMKPAVFGDTVSGGTGDDVVYGALLNRPIAGKQGSGSIEVTEPELYRLHADAARRVEAAMGGLPCEVEAVYEPDGALYIVQCKRMEVRPGIYERFGVECRMESRVIGRGAGVHGGAVSGVAALTADKDAIGALRERTGRPVILVRNEASTDDAHLMPLVAGIVTARGGIASHAAILAQKFGIAAVVGCAGLAMHGDGRAEFGGYLIGDGTAISIDGATGTVYSGTCALMTRERET